MRINHIAGLFIERTNARRDLFLRRIATRKITGRLSHFLGHRIFSARLECFHKFPGLCRVAACA